MSTTCWKCLSELSLGAPTCHMCGAEQNLAANWDVPVPAAERPHDRPTVLPPPVLLRIGTQATLPHATTFSVDDGVLTPIGRFTGNENAIAKLLNQYDDVSRLHLELLVIGTEEIQVTDKSKAGTYLHSRRLPPGVAQDLRLPIYLRLGSSCWLHLERSTR